MSDDVNAFLKGQGSKAFSFENIGDEVSGEIVAMDKRQQTDMQTGEPKTFPSGEPMWVVVITLQTELQDDESDDGTRTYWARGGNYTAQSGKGSSSLTALRDALRKSGAHDLEIGGWLSAAYTGTGKASAKGFSAPKLYTCEYKPPTQKVSLEDLG